MSKGAWLAGAVAGGLLLVGVGTSSGQGAAGEPSLQELDQKVRVLERKLELADEAVAARQKEAAVVGAGKDGFSLASADKAFQLKLRGYVQADARFYLDDDAKAETDSFLLRRVRPIAEGTLSKDYGFRIMPDFGGGSATLQDAYVDYRKYPKGVVRMGKFKPPVGLERLQSGTDTLFVERGLPTSLLPNRDVGIQLGGDVLGSTVNYAIGAFNGVADGGSSDNDANDSKDFAARLFLSPFKNAEAAALSGLSFGVAGSVGDQDGSLKASGLGGYKSIGQQNVFGYLASTNADSNVIADGQQLRVVPQATYYYRSVGLLAEYARSSHDVTKGAAKDTLDHEAWQVAASWAVTGEDAGFKGITPRKVFDPAAGTWGAFELVARYGELTLDDATFPTYADAKKSVSEITSWGAGVNWYLSRNVKLALDFDNSTYAGGSKAGDLQDEQVIMARAQLAY